MAESDLKTLLGNLNAERTEGRFVFVRFPDDDSGEVPVFAMVTEPEGLSAVISETDADRLGLEYDFVAGWITLKVNSALQAVGLTAAVSRCLTDEGISCNVIAGLDHDHLLVPADRVEAALSALRHLSAGRQ